MDQQLQDLVREMQDLTVTLKSLSETAGTAKMITREIDRVVKALALLSAETKKKNLSTQKAQKEIAKFEQQLEKASKAIDDNTDTVKDNTDQLDDHADAVKKDSDSILHHSRHTDRLRHKTSDLSDKFVDLGGGSQAARIGLEFVAAAAQGAAAAFKSYTTAIYAGERGAKASAKALTELSTPLLDMAGTAGNVALTFGAAQRALGKGTGKLGLILGGLGLATEGLGKIFNTVNEAGASQIDIYFNTYRALSSFGIGITDGLNGVKHLYQQLGLTTKEAEHFSRILTENSRTLGMFGGTMEHGAKRFSLAAGNMVKTLGAELEYLGITQDEQRELAMAYMNIQARTGQLQNKSTAQLTKGMAAFNRELDLAAQLTGQTRKEQAAAREAALAEQRFRAATIDAEIRGDVAAQQRLATAQRMAAIAQSQGDQRGFTGILQVAAAGGAMTTPEAVAAEMTYGVNQALQMPNPTDAALLQHMGNSVSLQQQSLASANRMVGNIDRLQTDLVAANDLQRRSNSLVEAAAKAGFSGPQAISQFLATEQKQRRETPSADVRTMTDAGRQQQNAALLLESTVNTFNLAADVHKIAADKFSSAVETFNDIVGAQEVSGGILQTASPAEQALSMAGGVPKPSDVFGKTANSSLGDLPSMFNTSIMDSMASFIGETFFGLPKFAKGGVTGSPSIAGEAGPEAVVPLPDGRTIPVSFENGLGIEEFNNSIDSFDRSIKKFTNLLTKGTFVDYLTSGPVFGREDKTLEEKTIKNLETLVELMTVATGGELPGVVKFGGGGLGTSGGYGGGGGGGLTGGGSTGLSTSSAPSAPGMGGGSGIKVNQQQLASEHGLTLRPRGGDIQAEGAQLNPKLIELAQKIQSSVPGFAWFTGFNDRFHQEKSPTSRHTKGLALDFVMQDPSMIIGNPEAGQEVAEMVKGLGAGFVLDEYNRPSAKSTGGHFHAEVPQAKMGGILTGPPHGFPATLHGTEAVVPLPDGKTIPVSMPGIDQMMSSIQNMIAPALGSMTESFAAPNSPISTMISSGISGLISSLPTATGPQPDMTELVQQLATQQNSGSGAGTLSADLLQQLISLQRDQISQLGRLIQVQTA